MFTQMTAETYSIFVTLNKVQNRFLGKSAHPNAITEYDNTIMSLLRCPFTFSLKSTNDKFRKLYHN